MAYSLVASRAVMAMVSELLWPVLPLPA